MLSRNFRSNAQKDKSIHTRRPTHNCPTPSTRDLPASFLATNTSKLICMKPLLADKIRIRVNIEVWYTTGGVTVSISMHKFQFVRPESYEVSLIYYIVQVCISSQEVHSQQPHPSRLSQNSFQHQPDHVFWLVF